MTIEAVDLNWNSDYVDSSVQSRESSLDTSEEGAFVDYEDDYIDYSYQIDPYGIKKDLSEDILTCNQFREQISAVADDKVYYYFMALIENSIENSSYIEWGNPNHRPHFFPDWLPWVHPAYPTNDYSEEEWVNLLREGIIYIYSQALMGTNHKTGMDDSSVKEEPMDSKLHLQPKVVLLKYTEEEIETFIRDPDSITLPKMEKMKEYFNIVEKQKINNLQRKKKCLAMQMYRSLPGVLEKEREKNRLRSQKRRLDPKLREKEREKNKLRSRRRRMNPEVREQERERQRLKSQIRRQDPKVRERAKFLKRLKRENPEYRAKENEARRLRKLNNCSKVIEMTDEVRLQKEEQREKERHRAATYRMDPEYREWERERAKLRRQRQREIDPEVRETQRLKKRKHMDLNSNKCEDKIIRKKLADQELERFLGKYRDLPEEFL